MKYARKLLCTCVTAKAPAPTRPTSSEPATFYFPTIIYNIFQLNYFFKNPNEINSASVNLKTKTKQNNTLPKKADLKVSPIY